MKEFYTMAYNHFTDEDGNYLRGYHKCYSPEDMIREMRLQWNGDRSERIYKAAQQALCFFCNQVNQDGGIAGGVSCKPTYYFIASNEYEERMIFCNRRNNMIGRLKNKLLQGRNFIALDKGIKLIREMRLIESPKSDKEAFHE